MFASPLTFISRPGLDRPALLTPAEQALLPHLLAGFSNKEIASALHKAEPTVKHQVSSMVRFGYAARSCRATRPELRKL